MRSPIQKKDYKFKESNSKLITSDLTFLGSKEAQPIVVFAHGFQGFKDWGGWPLTAEIFASKGLPFFKFNFSHNGTSPENLTEFVDLDSFGNNNFKIEYDDLGLVLDFISKKSGSFGFNWSGEIFLIGHSRGAAISMLRAAQDERITKLSTWAGVSNLEKYLELKEFNAWRKDGVHTIVNGRTKQEMPLNFQFVEAFAANAALLSVGHNLENLVCPLLIVHGEEDKVVSIEEAHHIYNEVQHSIIAEIESTGHTFGMKHPLTERKITKAFAEVISETIEFFNL